MNTAIFQENVTIITGASSGIGSALALQLAEQGAWLVLAARDAKRLEGVAEEVGKRGGRALVMPTDVSNQAECEHLIKRTVEEYGRIDTLVNNAGMTMTVPFEEVRDLEIFERLMRVNYLGSVYCTYFALPYLKQTKGRIVGIASLTGRFPVPTRTGYAASKHAMVGFFDSLRIELKRYGVTVTMIYPGFVATEVRMRALDANGKTTGQSAVRESEVMTAETAAKLIEDAMAQRRRELVMTWRGRLGIWLKPFLPRLVDHLSMRTIREGR